MYHSSQPYSPQSPAPSAHAQVSIFQGLEAPMLDVISSLQDFIYTRIETYPLELLENPELKQNMGEFVEYLTKLERDDLFERNPAREGKFRNLLRLMQDKLAIPIENTEIERHQTPEKAKVLCPICNNEIHRLKTIEFCWHHCLSCLADNISDGITTCPKCYSSYNCLKKLASCVSTKCSKCTHDFNRMLHIKDKKANLCEGCARSQITS